MEIGFIEKKRMRRGREGEREGGREVREEEEKEEVEGRERGRRRKRLIDYSSKLATR